MAAAMLLMLSWIAASDGEIADKEMDGLRTIAASGKTATDLREVIDLAVAGRVEDFQLACEVLRELEPKNRRLILQMGIGMALEDGYLTIAEAHIIRFIADLLSHSPADLDSLFREMTGEAFPKPGDPSSVDWWEATETRSHAGASESSRQSGSHAEPPSSSVSAPDLRRLRDLAMLGLDEHATAGHIQEAFRRMAMVHHPDKFVTLGPEAVKAAEMTFQRIRAAHERLLGR